jgi:hypothetical protein
MHGHEGSAVYLFRISEIQTRYWLKVYAIDRLPDVQLLRTRLLKRESKIRKYAGAVGRDGKCCTDLGGKGRFLEDLWF